MAVHALLIGSVPKDLGDPLEGIDNDLDRMEGVLEELDARITRCEGSDATMAGIVDAYRALIATTHARDCAVVYYAGHGQRVSGEHHRASMLDGARVHPWYYQYIVPYDYMASRPGDLRILTAQEMSYWLACLTDQTQNVTVVLDCCYAARISRGKKAKVRTRAVPTDVPMGFGLEDLRQHLHLKTRKGVVRRYPGGNPFAVRLVAARSHQPAVEYQDDNDRWMGLFTDCLCHALEEARGVPSATWAQVAQRARDLVTALRPEQWPGTEGPSDRELFGLEQHPRRRAVGVERLETGCRLEAGRIHGVGVGDEYLVVPPGDLRSDPASLAVARARVTVVRATASDADLELVGERARLPEACRAVLVAKAVPPHGVTLVGDGLTADGIADDVGRSPLLRVDDEAGGARLASVVVGEETVEITDAQGRPWGEVCVGADARRVVRILEAMARARNLVTLPAAEDTGLRSTALLELGRLVEGDREALEPGCTVRRQECMYLRIRNTGRTPRVFTAFLVGVDGEVRLLKPSEPDGIRLMPRQDDVLGDIVGDRLVGTLVRWPDHLPIASAPRPAYMVVFEMDRFQDLRPLAQAGARGGGPGATPLQRMLDAASRGGTRRLSADAGRLGYAVHAIEFSVDPQIPPPSVLDGPREDDPTTRWFGTRLALVVGIDAYAHGIEPLECAVSDAKEVAKKLQSHGFDVQLCVNEDATAEAMEDMARFETYPAPGKDDCLLVYFAGHGAATDSDARGHPRGCILPYGAVKDDESTYVPMSRLYGWLEELKCRHLLLVLDCCFAGSFRWAPAQFEAQEALEAFFVPSMGDRLRQYWSNPAWQVLTSAAESEEASDLVEPLGRSHRDRLQTEGHSHFCTAFLEGLDGLADTPEPGGLPDGVVTASEMHLYLRKRLADLGGMDGMVQTAELWPLPRHDRGEFLFRVPGADLDGPDRDVKQDENPWPGLHPYERGAHRFPGRRGMRDEIIAALQRKGGALVVVSGPSGSGKSSVVNAAVIPKLLHRGWAVSTELRSGPGDLEALEERAAELEGFDSQNRRLLVVDRLEELYTEAGLDAREAWMARLAELLGKGIRVVASARSEIVVRLENSPLARRPEWTRLPMRPMTLAELREVVVVPASTHALVLQPPGLVDEILDEVAPSPELLPLLNLTLHEMFERLVARGLRPRRLTREDYLAVGGVGGVRGAFAVAAEDFYERLEDDEERQALRAVLVRMASTEGILSRRRVELSELDFPDPGLALRVVQIVYALVEARLVIAGDGWREPASDLLVTDWHRVREWVDEAHGPISLQRALWRAASAWTEGEAREGRRDPELLWHRDPRLDDVLEVLERSGGSSRRPWHEADCWLNKREEEFVLASRARRDAEQEDARSARDRARVALARGLHGDPTVALAVLAEVEAPGDTPGWAEAAVRYLQEWHAQSILWPQPDLGPLWCAAFDPTGRWVALGGEHGSQLARADGRGPVLSLTDAGRTRAMAFADPRTLVVGGDDGAVRLFEVPEEAAPLAPRLEGRRVAVHGGPVVALSCSDDGELVASAAADGTARIHDRAGGEVAVVVHARPVCAIRFDAGRRVLTTSAGGVAKVRDLDGDGSEIVLAADTEPVLAAGFSADGTRVVTASIAGVVRVWSLDEPGRPLWSCDCGQPLWSASFAGEAVVGVSADGVLRRWTPPGDRLGEDLLRNDVRARPAGVRAGGAHDNAGARMVADRVLDLQAPSGSDPEDAEVPPWLPMCVSRDGRRVLTGSVDGVARLAVLGGGEEIALRSHGSAVTCVALDGDARLAVTASGDGTARVWPVGGRRYPEILVDRDAPGVVPLALAFDAGGERLLARYSDSEVRIWRVRGGSPPVVLRHPQAWGPVREAVFDGGGERVLTLTSTGLRLWSAVDGSLVSHIAGPTSVAAAFLDGGPDVIVASASGGVHRWGGSSGQPLEPVHPAGRRGGVQATFARDGRRLLRAFDGGEVELVDSVAGTLLAGYALDARPGRLTLRDPGGGGPEASEPRFEGASVLPGLVPSCLAVGRGGRRIAAGGDRGALAVWRSEAPEGRRRLDGHGKRVLTVGFSPDGERVVSASKDGTARVWSPDDPRPLFVLDARTHRVRDAVFSPDGTAVALATDDHDQLWPRHGTVQIWPLDVDRLEEAVQESVTACLPVALREEILVEKHETAVRRHRRRAVELGLETAS